MASVVCDGVRAEMLAADVLTSPEMLALLTVAYAVFQIGCGITFENVDRWLRGRAQQAEWQRLRDERADLLDYLGGKVASATGDYGRYCGLPSALVLAINVGTIAAARGWHDRLSAVRATSPAYARLADALRADSALAADDLADALAAAPWLARPEVGPPRGLWLTAAERAAAAALAASAPPALPSASGGGPLPPGGDR